MAAAGLEQADPRVDDAGPRRARVEQVMGMPISIHVRGVAAGERRTAGHVAGAFRSLRDADAVFSTYRDDSEISRLRRGELDLAACGDDVREVHRLCLTARERTDGWFDAWGWRDGFDPTGLVKGWAVARSARSLWPLVDAGADIAIDAGGDVLVRSASGDPWRIGIEDPRDRRRVLATVEVVDGAVATSGPAARGAHIVDPHSGLPSADVLSATVVGPSMLWADVWATTAVARGAGAVDWVHGLHGTSGLLVLADGGVERWSVPE